MSIELNDVCIDVSQKRLIDHVSVCCQPGVVLGILGENGAGKSTLLNAMAGLTTPTSGDITLNDRALADYPVTELSRLRAVLPQNSDLSFPLDAIEVVRLALCFSACPLAEQEALLLHCLTRFGVDALAHRDYLTLSGGEKQRVQLARVAAQLESNRDLIAERHQFLLLDEPISALDLHHQYKTMGNLRDVANSGIGVVTILHDINLAAMVCDELLILKEGRVIAHGAPTQVITEDTIHQAFMLNARVQPHPDTGTPFVMPITQNLFHTSF